MQKFLETIINTNAKESQDKLLCCREVIVDVFGDHEGQRGGVADDQEDDRGDDQEDS